MYPFKEPWVIMCVYNPIVVEGWDRALLELVGRLPA